MVLSMKNWRCSYVLKSDSFLVEIKRYRAMTKLYHKYAVHNFP